MDTWYLMGSEWEWAKGNKSTTKALSNIVHWFGKQLASKNVQLCIGYDLEICQLFRINILIGSIWILLTTMSKQEKNCSC